MINVEPELDYFGKASLLRLQNAFRKYYGK